MPFVPLLGDGDVLRGGNPVTRLKLVRNVTRDLNPISAEIASTVRRTNAGSLSIRR